MMFKQAQLVFFILLSGLVVSACNLGREAINPSLIDHRAPFGIAWQFTENDLKSVTSERRRSCEQQVSQIPSVLQSMNAAALVEECIFARWQFLSVDRSDLPKGFRDGSIALNASSRNGPAAIWYAFKHCVGLDCDEINEEDRQTKFDDLFELLKQSYGKPLASTEFLYGFVSLEFEDDPDKPCRVWVKDDIGIFLCRERLVLKDGVETSLSFHNLSEDPLGGVFLAASRGIEFSSNVWLEQAHKPQQSSASQPLEVLARWTEDRKFRSCSNPNLKPLNGAAALEPDERAQFADELQTLSGDELAEFAIEFAAQPRDLELDALVDFLNHDPPFGVEDRKILFLLRRASDLGSAIAQNELGAALLYCDFGAAQDLERAQALFEQASSVGDPYAAYNLATMSVLGMTKHSDPIAETNALIASCARAGMDECVKIEAALSLLMQ